MSLLIDLIDPQEDIVFIGGTALDDLRVNVTFSALYRYQGQSKNRTHIADVDLTVTTLIHEGEPVDAAVDGDEVLVGVTGDTSRLQTAADDAGWRQKRNRYLRTTNTALLLE